MEGSLPTLRDVRGTILEVECKVCDRHAKLDRAALVKRYGAGIRFVDLRRILALGCERMNAPGGDQCGTRFPCLLTSGIAFSATK